MNSALVSNRHSIVAVDNVAGTLVIYYDLRTSNTKCE